MSDEDHLKNYVKMNKLNSIFTWLPLVEKVVPTPRTVLIPEEPKVDPSAALSGRPDAGFKHLVDAASLTAAKMGFPIFIKTGQVANKHDWKNSCYVTNFDQIPKAIANLLEFTEMQMFGPSFDGIAVRQFLKLDYRFHAFNGFPVAREFRFFIKNGEVQCRHPYWPASSLQEVTSKHWLKKLRAMQGLGSGEQKILDLYSRKISRAVESLGAPDNYWSLDFCIDAEQNNWWLTDMATGDESYHYTSCKFSPQEQKEMYPDPDDISEVTLKGGMDKKFEAWAKENLKEKE